MNKIFTLSVVLLAATLTYGQSTRTVLFEEETNASCGPCAAQNPTFHALLDQYPTNVVSIKYQGSFPGYDPMNLHNPGQVTARESYYNIESVPTAMMDGEKRVFGSNAYAGAPAAYDEADIDGALAIPSQFDIELDYTLTETEITVSATAACTQAVEGDLKLHIVIIEKEIVFESAPGSNGEKEFYNVMKRMLPSASGSAMEDVYEVGESFETEVSWALSNIYNLNSVAVVAFIQDDTDKSVLQAAELYKPYNTLDAQALIISELPDFTCDQMVAPSIEIRNMGADELTSLTLNYVVNEDVGTVNWTGSIAFYETAIIDLGDITFEPQAQNEITVTISNTNDGTEDVVDNNSSSALINFAPTSPTAITVEIHTDYYAGETFWDLKNSAGETLASAEYSGPVNGGGSNAVTIKTHQVTIDTLDCISFNLYDGYGDGLQYSGPTGTEPYGYRILDASGNVILQELSYDFNFGYEYHRGLNTGGVLAVADNPLESSLDLFPNPTSDQITLTFDPKGSGRLFVDVYNITGKLVKNFNFGNLHEGTNYRTLDVSDLNAGVFMVHARSESGLAVRKLVVNK